MTSRPQNPDDRSTDRGTPPPGDASQRRDRGLRLSRRLTRSLVGTSAALVLGFSVLAATNTGTTGGSANPVTTTDTGRASATTTGGSGTSATTATDSSSSADGNGQSTGTSSGSASSSSSAPSSSSATPATTSAS